MPIIVKDLPKRKRRVGQWIANISVCISYSTGEPLFYSVRTKLDDCESHRFLSLEEAMLWCDINGYWIDTEDWDNPKIGLVKFYSPSDKVTLDDGRTVVVGY